MISREQQLLGIEVPCLRKTLRLFRAAARVRSVHEPTLVLHERVQSATRARQLLAEAVTADVEQFRPDSIAHTKDVAKDIDKALLTVEAKQHARRASDARLIDHQLHIRRDCSRIRQV